MARRRQFSDAEILEAARACFLEHGPSVSTAHIAGEIGLSQAALFKRFQTKENLLLQALRPDPIPEWLVDLHDGPSDAPVPDQLVAIGTRALAFLRDLMPRLLCLKSAGVDPSTVMATFDVPPPLRAVTMLTAFFEALASDGRADIADPSATATQFLGSLHLRVYFGHMFEHASLPVEDDAYLRSVVDSLWLGIAPQEAR